MRAMSERDKFRLKDFGKMQITEEEVVWAARNAATLLKPIPQALAAYRNEYVLDLFYRGIIRASESESVKQLEFEEDFYLEDLDTSLSKLLLSFKKLIQYIFSLSRKFRVGREKDIQLALSGR